MAKKWPYSKYDSVNLVHRIEPFLADEPLTVLECRSIPSKIGRKTVYQWRIYVTATNRPASGWVDADNLVLVSS